MYVAISRCFVQVIVELGCWAARGVVAGAYILCTLCSAAALGTPWIVCDVVGLSFSREQLFGSLDIKVLRGSKALETRAGAAAVTVFLLSILGGATALVSSRLRVWHWKLSQYVDELQ
jgi:hypothetical protein